VLKENIVKWGGGNVVVTNNDPKDFSILEGFFDVLVVDAPCSGSGLFRRDPEAVGEWSLNSVQLCSQRQQRILADSWPSLKNGGVLIYSTCSYSKEEDEDIMDWMVNELGASNCQLETDPGWGILETVSATGNKGYRFWPDKVKGEGFFLACFRKTTDETSPRIKIRKQPDIANRIEVEMIAKWMITDARTFIKHQQTVYSWPSDLFQEFAFLLEKMRVIYSGVKVGELMRDKLVPDHALAMSELINPSLRRVELSKESAIRYLQRKEITLEGEGTGWVLACYKGNVMGWVNILPGRINNYYPKELRILKDI
jgi:NOL1/NOP2/fmu family ribosome biogenesis protein